jgi:hypothetical protein
MQFYGYIEGYYGREFTQEQRLSLIRSMPKLKLNSYLIASKEDPYHRLRWRDEPPQLYFDNLNELIAQGRENGVTVIPAIAPGLSFTYNDRNDERALLHRIEQFVEAGAETVALLMDDIPLELPETVKNRRVSLGTVHGELLRKISLATPQVQVLFCPTLYTDELLESGSEATHYLADLHESAPETTQIFWTGKSTIAREITAESCCTATDIFGERVIFWDNIYANDYATTRLFVGPFQKRNHQFITTETSGIMVNPTGMFLTDQIIMTQFSHWLQNENCSWEKIAEEFAIPEEFTPYLPWFSSPFEQRSLDMLSDSESDPLHFFNTIIVNWQGELKQEWYPYLHRFFTELKLSRGMTGEREWFQQRFYPHTASKIYSETEERSKFFL